MRLHHQFWAVLFCFATALANSHCFGQENGTLLSVSITNGTSVAPRSMFIQTWTFQNNGTKVWAPGPNGFTLNMVGLDSLGAIPYCTNTFNTNTFPRAVINSGKAVVPGGTGSFSMEFIAPEVSGSYTDSFQLSGTNWFGPIVTVQVAVEPGGNTNVFDRSRAISYANNYATNVCSDGYFWTNQNYPDFAFYGTGVLTPVPVGPPLDGGIGDDCAHYVSCCIGNEPHLRGGGINVPSRTSPTYGEPSASDIINNVLLAPGYGVQVSSLRQLEPGDIVGWNWAGNTNMSAIEHVTLYMGNGLFSCHAASILDVNSAYFGTGWAWHLIHILDYPTLWTTRSGTSTTFTWTTNWNKYALYSAPSLTGTWSKVSTKPTVTGITNKLTLTMPSSGSVFYRLEMP